MVVGCWLLVVAKGIGLLADCWSWKPKTKITRQKENARGLTNQVFTTDPPVNSLFTQQPKQTEYIRCCDVDTWTKALATNVWVTCGTTFTTRAHVNKRSISPSAIYVGTTADVSTPPVGNLSTYVGISSVHPWIVKNEQNCSVAGTCEYGVPKPQVRISILAYCKWPTYSYPSVDLRCNILPLGHTSEIKPNSQNFDVCPKCPYFPNICNNFSSCHVAHHLFFICENPNYAEGRFIGGCKKKKTTPHSEMFSCSRVYSGFAITWDTQAHVSSEQKRNEQQYSPSTHHQTAHISWSATIPTLYELYLLTAMIYLHIYIFVNGQSWTLIETST